MIRVPNVPFRDDNTQRPVELCSLQLFLLKIAELNNKVIITTHTRHTQRTSEREVDPVLCTGDFALFCNSPAALENPRCWAHERTPGRSGKC